MPAEGMGRVVQEEGTACAKARRPNSTWSNWNTDQSAVCLTPDHRNLLHINSLAFILQAMSSH